MPSDPANSVDANSIDRNATRDALARETSKTHIDGGNPPAPGLRDYLALCRVFLWPTALADSLAGFALASAVLRASPHPRVLLFLPFASLGLFGFGLVANDIFDRHRDARIAPGKPLPSGRVALASAALLAVLLLAVGLSVAWYLGALGAAAIVAVCALLYDAGLKRIPALGEVAMGACRGGNLLLGAEACGAGGVLSHSTLLAAALVLSIYIAGVTAVSRLEERPSAWNRFRASVLLFPAAAAFLPCLAASSPVAWFGAAILVASLLSSALRAMRAPISAPPAAVFVRGALGAIYFVDAAILWVFAPAPRAVLIPGIGLYALAVFGWWWKRRWLHSGGADT